MVLLYLYLFVGLCFIWCLWLGLLRLVVGLVWGFVLFNFSWSIMFYSVSLVRIVVGVVLGLVVGLVSGFFNFNFSCGVV